LEHRHLHIVSLDVPFPADYGGAIDIFYRIKALHELGVQITLHVFEYGRGKQKELEKYAKVIYYRRKRGVLQQLSSRPFIVQSRKNAKLLENLLKDNHPILFEGIHTTCYLEHPEIQKRTTMVRMHNLEHEYYKGLRKNASWLKKLFFRLEAMKLENYQQILSYCTTVLAIKESDAEAIKKLNPNVRVLPASLPDLEGTFGSVGRYALFHGNLSVPENQKAAYWIMDTLDSILDQHFELVIAGKRPGKKLRVICAKKGVRLVADPSDLEMDRLVCEAQLHVLYSPVDSGVKLKLLACLHSSGHILLNSKMLGNKAFKEFCVVADDPKEYKLHFIGLRNKALTEEAFNERKKFLDTHFNNRKNCQTILELIDAE
jgi:hypothetical protein